MIIKGIVMSHVCKNMG